jgi:hypothetical protein
MVVAGISLDVMALLTAFRLGLHIGGRGARMGAFLLFVAGVNFATAIGEAISWRNANEAMFGAAWVCCLFAAIFNFMTAVSLLRTVRCEPYSLPSFNHLLFASSAGSLAMQMPGRVKVQLTFSPPPTISSFSTQKIRNQRFHLSLTLLLLWITTEHVHHR